MGTPYSYPSGPDSCEGLARCPLVEDPSHPVLIAIYSFWSLCAFIYAIFFCTRFGFSLCSSGSIGARVGKGLHRVPTHDGDDAEDWSSTHRLADEESGFRSSAEGDFGFAPNALGQLPLRRSRLGSVCLVLWSAVSTLFICMFLVLIVDYYYDCQVHGIDSLCFFGSHPIFGDYDSNSQYFICNWFLSLVWFAITLIFKNQISVWFMRHCSMQDADCVLVSVQNTASLRSIIESQEKVHVLVLWMRRTRRLLTVAHLRDGRESLVEVSMTKAGAPFFIFEAKRYVYNPKCDCFQVPRAHIIGKSFADFHSEGRRGLDAVVAAHRLSLFGPNKIHFARRSAWSLFRDEVTTFFYLYQLMMYLVWFWFSYLFVASIEFAVVLSGAIVSTYLQWSGEDTIAALTNYETTVVVRRGGVSCSISSNDVVPGDIMLISKVDWIVPCDMVIIEGSCIMDESGLTGESMPLQKKSCANDVAISFDPTSATATQHTVFAGTTILQLNDTLHPSNAGTDAPCIVAYVTAAGSSTRKGELVSSILFPEELRFRYEEELEVVIGILLLYGILSFVLVVYLITRNGSNSTWITKWVYGMFTASQIFSPLLPVALKVGQIRSSQRLREKSIYCVSPRHIAICGRINVFCFDKTGTLTKDGMDFSGAIPVVRHPNADCVNCWLGNLLSSFPVIPKTSSLHHESIGPTVVNPIPEAAVQLSELIPDAIVECMATCHNIALYAEDRLVGTEVDVKMFSATGWSICSSTADNRPGLSNDMVISPDRAKSYKILKRFEFDHSRQCMSVIAEDVQTRKRYIITKGSFEKLAVLCRPDSIPLDFLSQGRQYAMLGGYVLGLGRREMNEGYTPLGDLGVAELSRDSIEMDQSLELLSLLIFRNEAKPESCSAIRHLRQGHVRPVMITGDNAQCGQYIARACAMVDPEAHILLAELSKSTGEVSWSYMSGKGAGRGGEPVIFAEQSFLPSSEDVIRVVETNKLRAEDGSRIELAISGNDTLKALEGQRYFERLLPSVRMFARMSPENKAFVIRKFRDTGFTVGMCGDGGNDCGALRAAHAGIALSDSDASVVSPFTSRSKSPESVVDLLREGRASLATSLANYKFLITYGLQFSIVKLCSFYYGVLMSIMAYYFIDGVALTTLCYTMTLSRPLGHLSQMRPSASLLGPSTVASVIGVNGMVLICLVCALFLMEGDPDYVQWPSQYSAAGDWWYISDNWEATVLYVVMYFFLLSSALIYSFGYKFREGVCQNSFLIANIGSLFLLTTLLTLMDTNMLTDYWHMASFKFNGENPANPVWRRFQESGGKSSPAMSVELRFKLYFLVVGCIAFAALWQAEVVEGSIANIIRVNFTSQKSKLIY